MFITPRSVFKPSTGARARLWLCVGFVAVFVWTMLNLPPRFAAADNAQKPGHILVLFSNSRVLPANIELDRGFRETLLASRRDAEISTEFLDYPRFAGETYAAITAGYLRDKYALRPPDVVVAVGPDAFEFILRSQLFIEKPFVHVGILSERLRTKSLPRNVVGIPIDLDFAGTIALALQLHPKASRLVVVTGASPPDKSYETRLRQAAGSIANRIETEFLAGLPSVDVLKRLKQLDGRSVVVTTGYFEDGEGRTFTPRSSVIDMVGVSGAPIYAAFDTFLGTGVVGGRISTFMAHGQAAAGAVARILAGELPSALNLPPAIPTTAILDWRAVQRWGIETKSVPANAEFQFKNPTFWESYWEVAIAGAGLIVFEAGLIAWLLFERRRRFYAEGSVHKQQLELAHASRLAVLGELTASIAHEVNQPLGAILSNAAAAELILASGKDRSSDLRDILRDIRRDDIRASEVIRRLRGLLEKHEVEHQLFDINEAVAEAAQIIDADATRRGINLTITLAKTPVFVLGDPIQIQQVLINLVINAMDAVEGLPVSRKIVLAKIEVLEKYLELTISDSGRGIAPDDLPKIFDSFFTTKRRGIGLGLSIVQSLVAVHGGRVWAENGSNGGAVFRVALPRPHLRARG